MLQKRRYRSMSISHHFAIVFLGTLLPVIQASNTDLVNQRVLPVLRANCSSCHAQASAAGGLSFDSLDAALSGGEHGPALIPGSSKQSLILQHVRGEKSPKMPMGGSLSGEVIAVLASAIDEMQ